MLSAESTDSPLPLYASPRTAYAIANFGSMSMARRKKGVDATSPDTISFIPVL